MCSFCHSSKMLLATANRSHYKKPQIDTMQRSMAYRNSSTCGYIGMTTPISMAQGTSAKERKIFKSQNIIVCSKFTSLINSCIKNEQ